MAIKNCISALIGFGSSVIAGKVLTAIQINGNMIFGVHIYSQQFLSAISFALIKQIHT